MRTTVTLDPDVAERLRAYALRNRMSLRQALNQLIRRGLRAQEPPAARTRFEVVPHQSGLRPGVDPRRLNQTVDELEVARFVASLRPPR